MAEVCPACKPVPDALLAKAVVAERYGKGAQYARQQLYAAFDLGMHGARCTRTDGAADEDGSRDPARPCTGHDVPGRLQPCRDYGAGYYGYLGSEVVAADLRTAFSNDKLSTAVGRRYRDNILANGGQPPPQQLVRQSLGRDSNSKAFFADLQR